MVFTTEVVATRAGPSATCATSITITKVTVGAGCQVGVEVMTATPSGAVAVMTVLVVSANSCMFIVVRQREQEVTSASCPTVVVPVGGRITTDQTTRV